MRFNLFLFALIVILFVSSISQGLRKVEVISPFYAGTTSPFNTEWNGTSIIASKLMKVGYTITQCRSYDELSFITGIYRPRRIIYLSMAPSKPMTSHDFNEIKKLMEQYSLSIIIADEMTTSNDFLKEFNIEITGKLLLSELGTPFPISEFIVRKRIGTSYYTLLLNYASWIIARDKNIEIVGRCTDGKITALSKVIGDDMILVLSDSSIFINLMQELSTSTVNYTSFALDLIEYACMNAKPEDTIIVFDLIHQETPDIKEALKHVKKVEVLLHPVMILAAITSLVYSLERMTITFIVSDPIRLALFLTSLLTVIVAILTLRYTKRLKV